MSEPDPTDELLRQAFATDLARTPTVNVAGRVMKRIRARQRLRTVVLSAAGAISLATMTAWAGPDLGALAGALQGYLPAGWQADTVLLALTAMAGVVWLVTMEEDLI